MTTPNQDPFLRDWGLSNSSLSPFASSDHPQDSGSPETPRPPRRGGHIVLPLREVAGFKRPSSCLVMASMSLRHPSSRRPCGPSIPRGGFLLSLPLGCWVTHSGPQGPHLYHEGDKLRPPPSSVNAEDPSLDQPSSPHP